MSIQGAIGAAVRVFDPYPEASLALDFAGLRTGGRPFYKNSSPIRPRRARDVSGLTYTGGAGLKTMRTSSGLFLLVPANEPGETDLGYASFEARTNTCLHSNNLTVSSAWSSRNDCTPTSLTDSMFGTVSRLNNDSQASICTLAQGPVTTTVGDVVCRSAYVKADGAASVGLRSASTSGTGYGAATFTFATKSLVLTGGATAGGFEELPNGWFRIWFYMTTDAGAATQQVALRLVNSATDPINSGAFVAFCQAEIGVFPTPYIPTTTTASTRTADALDVTGISLPTGDFDIDIVWRNNPDMDGKSVTRRIFEMHNGSDSERILLQTTTTDGVNASVVVANTTTQIGSTLFTGVTGGVDIAASIQRRSGVWRFICQGSQRGSDTVADVPSINSLALGRRRNGLQWANTNIKSFRLTPR